MKNARSLPGFAKKSEASAIGVRKGGFLTFEDAATFAFTYVSEHMECRKNLAVTIDDLKPPRPGVAVSEDFHGFQFANGSSTTCTLSIELDFNGRYVVEVYGKRCQKMQPDICSLNRELFLRSGNQSEDPR